MSKIIKYKSKIINDNINIKDIIKPVDYDIFKTNLLKFDIKYKGVCIRMPIIIHSFNKIRTNLYKKDFIDINVIYFKSNRHKNVWIMINKKVLTNLDLTYLFCFDLKDEDKYIKPNLNLINKSGYNNKMYRTTSIIMNDNHQILFKLKAFYNIFDLYIKEQLENTYNYLDLDLDLYNHEGFDMKNYNKNTYITPSKISFNIEQSIIRKYKINEVFNKKEEV